MASISSYISDLPSFINLLTYYFPLRDVIEHDEVTKHCNETYQTKSCYNVDDSILQAELS